MSLKRILKLLMAIVTSQGAGIVTQLLIPPLFLHRYVHGVEVYGEWIALTAAVAYLGALNNGIQTYANNQMTIHYNRGEMDEAKAVQASALRLCLVLILLGSAAGVSVLFMPLGRWIGLHYTSSASASLTLFLMIVQVMVSWFFFLLAYSFMVIGQLHRGANWMTAQRFAGALLMATFLWHRASFPVLAASQLGAMGLFTLLVVIDIRISAPILLPSLRYGSWGGMISILKPSWYFLLGGLSSFLWWQGPVLLIEKLLGPSVVAVFALTRTVFNMSRQMMVALTYAISQDITALVGQRNWAQLRRLYDLSERVVLLMVPTATIGVLLLCPALFSIWLHNRALYTPLICLPMAMISAVMGIKEHKLQFQASSNQHQKLVRFTIASYCLMLLSAGMLLPHFGVRGLLAAWLVTEIAQTFYILRLNQRLFPPEVSLPMTPVLRLGAVLTAGFAIAIWPIYHDAAWSLMKTILVAGLITAGLATLSYFCFGLQDVRSVITAKLRRRRTAVEQING